MKEQVRVWRGQNHKKSEIFIPLPKSFIMQCGLTPAIKAVATKINKHRFVVRAVKEVPDNLPDDQARCKIVEATSRVLAVRAPFVGGQVEIYAEDTVEVELIDQASVAVSYVAGERFTSGPFKNVIEGS